MEYKITAPNKNYSGISAGVRFFDGVGIAYNDNNIEWFKQKGYLVEAIKEKKKVGDSIDGTGDSKGKN